MNIRVENRFRHHCELSQTVLGKFKSPGVYSKITRYAERLYTVTVSHESRRYHRSRAEFRKAKSIHLTNPKYRYVVHPFSIFARREVIFMQWLWLMMTLLDNFMGTFMGKELFYDRNEYVLMLVLYAGNLCFLGDIVMKFCTGFVVERTRTVVLEPKAIARRYLKTYFLFDFMPVFGYVIFYHLPEAHPMTLCLLFQLHKLRLVRIKSVIGHFDRVLDGFRTRELVRKLIELIIVGLITIHVLTSLSGLYLVYLRIYKIPNNLYWYIKVRQDREKNSLYETFKNTRFGFVVRYLIHMNVVSCHFFGVQNSKYKTRDPTEMIFLSLVLIFGLSYYVYCIARMMQHVGVVKVSESKFDELIFNADYYMVKKNFPQSLKSRVNRYYEYKFNNKYFNETSILGTLSEHLQMEVLLYSCQNLIHRVQVFNGLSKSAVGCILSLLKQEIFVPKDRIIKAGDEEESVYFILFGTCGIEPLPGKEVMHIEDGDHFGNVAGFQYDVDTKLVYNVMALEMVELYRLDREDIVYCVRMYPEIQTKLDLMERMRVRKYQKMFEMSAENEDVTEDIINELRRGKILRHGITRDVFS